MKKIILFLVLCCFHLSLMAQQQATFTQLYFNPALYNPSFVAYHDEMELFLTHRRQWVGIEDAPTVSGFDFQYPTAEKISLGLTASTHKTVLLSSSKALANIVYHLPLGEGQKFNFGLSAGLGMNNFDISDESILDDPALQGVVGKSAFLDGRFGINYSYRGFSLGFALPKIFKSKVNNVRSFGEVSLDALEEKIFTASYKYQKSGSDLSFQPFLLYRGGTDGRRQIEASMIGYFKDALWAGGSYRKDDGLAVLFGAKVKDRYRIAYAYEFGALATKGVPNGTHEIQVNIKFAKKRKSEVDLLAKRTAQKTEELTYLEDSAVESDELAEVPDRERVEEAKRRKKDDDRKLKRNRSAEERQSSSEAAEEENAMSMTTDAGFDDPGSVEREEQTLADIAPVNADAGVPRGLGEAARMGDNGADDGILDEDEGASSAANKKRKKRAKKANARKGRGGRESKVMSSSIKRWSGFNTTIRDKENASASTRNRVITDRGAPGVNAAGVPYMKKGFYVVVGAFNGLANARSYVQKMRSAGHKVELATRKSNGMYYLYTFDTGVESDARLIRDKMRKRKGFQFPMSWLLVID